MATQSEFQDYDFDASGLSVIADILAYNTHQNALLGNFALNETFLQTAQLRTSLVNLATNFAYVPRSKSASTALLNVSLNLTPASNKPEEIYLPSGFQFTTELDDVTYTFITDQEYTAKIDDAGLGIYTFVDDDDNLAIPVREGVEKVKTFLVDTSLERQIYVIPDSSMDLSTLRVRVFNDTADTVGESYLSPAELVGFGAETRLYLPLETYNGFYELNFGDGTITGKAPEVGNIVRATYLSTNGGAANGASLFVPTTTLSVDGTSYNLTVTTVAKSTLGAEKESIESIRLNAPLSYLAQGRLVTPNDYIAVISNLIPGIKSMNAWGGEDNIPAKYGKVLVSIIYEDDIDASFKASLETRIASEITDNLSIASIETEIVNPDFTYLNLTTNIKYDSGITALTRRGIQDKIKGAIAAYFTSNLGRFNDVFRKSKLLSVIDNTDDSILSSSVDVRMENRFTPVYDANTVRYITADYQLNFLNKIAHPDEDHPVVTSDNFVYRGKVASIRNRTGENHSNILEIIDTDENVLVTNIGSYDTTKGTVTLNGFSPTSISSGNSYIRIIATPADDNNIKPLRNHVIDLGFNVVRATPDTNAANAVSGVTD
jgi:hypothetical protein